MRRRRPSCLVRRRTTATEQRCGPTRNADSGGTSQSRWCSCLHSRATAAHLSARRFRSELLRRASRRSVPRQPRQSVRRRGLYRRCNRAPRRSRLWPRPFRSRNRRSAPSSARWQWGRQRLVAVAWPVPPRSWLVCAVASLLATAPGSSRIRRCAVVGSRSLLRSAPTAAFSRRTRCAEPASQILFALVSRSASRVRVSEAQSAFRPQSPFRWAPSPLPTSPRAASRRFDLPVRMCVRCVPGLPSPSQI